MIEDYLWIRSLISFIISFKFSSHILSAFYILLDLCMGIAFGNDADKNDTGVLPVQSTHPPCTPHHLKSGEDEILHSYSSEPV